MSRTFYYKLTVDNGGAPCVQDRLLSLAICKPTIRRCAQRGDWIVGFGAKSFRVVNRASPNGRAVPGKPLLFVARVTAKELDGSYYMDGQFGSRRDRIYERTGARFRRLSSALYHAEPERLTEDLGDYPDYGKSAVLLSDDFRYFPDGGTFDYELLFPDIREAFDRVHRMHGVAMPGTELAAQFAALQRWLWREFGQHVSGSDPRDLVIDTNTAPSARSCVIAAKGQASLRRRKVGRTGC